MSGAVSYEGTARQPDGAVMADKIIYFHEEPGIDETVLHFTDGNMLWTRTSVAELKRRINQLAAEQAAGAAKAIHFSQVEME